MRARGILAESIGWYGTIAVLSAYALLLLDVFSAQSMLYQLLNASGAAALIFISYRKRAFEPMTLNGFWLIIALIALGRMVV